MTAIGLAILIVAGIVTVDVVLENTNNTQARAANTRMPASSAIGVRARLARIRLIAVIGLPPRDRDDLDGQSERRRPRRHVG